MAETVTITNLLMKYDMSYTIVSDTSESLVVRILNISIGRECLTELLANGLRAVGSIEDMVHVDFSK